MNKFALLSDEYTEFVKEAIYKIHSNVNFNDINFDSLIGGLSKSKLFKFDIYRKTYVLRLLDKNIQVQNRISEIRSHKIAADLEIAPKIFYIDSEDNPQIVVMEFIDGRLFNRKDLSNKTLLKNIMVALKNFHNSSKENCAASKTMMDAIINLYERKLRKGTVYPSVFNEMLNELQENYKQFTGNKSRIHGDLNPDNIMVTKEGKIYFIDFALSGSDNPFADLGWFACLLGATNEQIESILEAYLGRTPECQEINEIKFFINESNFFLATLWIGRQNERCQDKLDKLLNSDIKKGSEYIRSGITVADITKQNNSLELTKYALSWLKDFKEA